MKNLIYFLLIILSGYLYAEDFQIVLDPFQGTLEEDKNNAPEEAVDHALWRQQIYKKECSLTAIEDGFSEECFVSNIVYRAEQCSSTNKDSICSTEDVIVDESTSLQYPLELFLEQPTYFKDCSINTYEDESYLEYCSPFEDEDTNQDIEDSISLEEETLSPDIADTEQSANDIDHQEEIVFPEFLETTQKGVGKLVAQVKQKNLTSLGSGFFINNSNGQPVFTTNYHVLGAALLGLFITGNLFENQEWFSETSDVVFYVQQGEQKFRVTGVRDMSLMMDLAVLEVENYDGDVLSLSDHYSNEVPVYILGYPGGHMLQKIKATNSFAISELYHSFIVSMNDCYTLRGVSGSPALNTDGEVIGVAFAINPLADCKNLRVAPVSGVTSMDLTSPVKTSKEDLANLIKEQELLFYDQLLFDPESKKDLTTRAVFYLENNMLISRVIHPMDEDQLLNIYQKLSDPEQELNEEDEDLLQFLVQRNIANIQGLDINKAAQLGSIEARWSLATRLYMTSQFEKAYPLFQELIQLRVPLHLYVLSQLYYWKEDNPAQACRLLTYAKEPVEILDELYQEYDCDDVLNGAS